MKFEMASALIYNYLHGKTFRWFRFCGANPWNLLQSRCSHKSHQHNIRYCNPRQEVHQNISEATFSNSWKYKTYIKSVLKGLV